MTVPPDSKFTAQSPWLDLVNSRMGDGFGEWTDHLLDARWVTRFLRYWGTASRDLAPGSAPAQLTDLREVLCSMTEIVAAGATLGSSHLEVLNAYLREPGFPQVARSAGKLVVTPEPVRPGWRWIRARIVVSFIRDVQACPERIKTCGNPDCRWAFHDATRGNIRRWCRDRRCGNRLRVRRSRARARHGSAGS